MFLLSLPTLLLVEHSYNPVSSLLAFVIVKFTLTLVTFPFPVGTPTLSLTDTLSLKVPLVLLHSIVGGGYPIASHVIVVVSPSVITVVVFSSGALTAGKTNAKKITTNKQYETLLSLSSSYESL